MDRTIEAFIFDLDGVIVDTAHYHFMSWKALANELDISLPDEMNENLKGLGRMESLEVILKYGEIEISHEEKLRLAAKKNSWYVENISHLSSGDTLPGVLTFLDKCDALGLRLAVGSGSKNARPILERLGITDRFAAICDGTNITKSKPDPEVFQCACKALGVDPGKAVVFEDATSGIAAAIACGTRTIGVGQPDILTNAEIVIPALDQQDPEVIISKLSETL